MCQMETFLKFLLLRMLAARPVPPYYWSAAKIMNSSHIFHSGLQTDPHYPPY